MGHFQVYLFLSGRGIGYHSRRAVYRHGYQLLFKPFFVPSLCGGISGFPGDAVFLIPIKVKYLAILDAVYFVVVLIVGTWPLRVSILMSLLNVLLFFGGDFSVPSASRSSTAKPAGSFAKIISDEKKVIKNALPGMSQEARFMRLQARVPSTGHAFSGGTKENPWLA